MNKLPAEILQKIFDPLHQRQKLECVLTCHKWMDVIKYTCLYNTVRIYNNNMLDNLMKEIQSDQSRRNQVKRLVIGIHVDKEIDFSMFPHLQVIYADHRWRSQVMESQKNPKNKTLVYPVQTIIETNNYRLTLKILNSGICPYLTSLAIYINQTYIYGYSFIPLLKSAPNINKLVIRSVIISISDLELLHATLNLLKSVSFERSIIYGDKLPDKINPATSVTSFICDARSADPETDQMVANYLYEKYINVLEISSNFIQLDDKRILPNLLNHCNVWNSITSKISILHYGEVNGLYGLFGRFKDIKIDNELPLTILKRAIQPNQSKYIQTLILKGDDMVNFGYLKELPKLKNLELIYTFKQDNFSILFKNILDLNNPLGECFDTLESIKVENVVLKEDIHPTRSYSIKSLTFSYTKFAGRLDFFILQSFPQLHTLKLNFCDFDDIKEISIPQNHLYHFEITMPEPTDGNSALLVECLTKDEELGKSKRYWYTASENKQSRSILEQHFEINDYSIFPETCCEMYCNAKYTPFMTLICASVYRIIVKHPI